MNTSKINYRLQILMKLQTVIVKQHNNNKCKEVKLYPKKLV